MDEKKDLPRLLVVEDEELNYLYLQIILNKLKIDHYWVTTGEAAIEYCQSHEEVSLVLMDVKLPGIDGLTATQEILKNRSDIHIVAVTAFAMHGDKKMTHDAGCVGHITKPINRANLENVIRNYLT